MKRTLMLLSTMMLAILLAGGLALVAGSPAARADVDCQTSGSNVVCTFTHTGAAQTWTVPDEVTQATFDVFGAQGGSEPGLKAGGGGGKAHATIDVTPGDTLQVNVGGVGGAASCLGCGAGGAGGFNGGAAGGSGSLTGAGGGGGASDIRTGAFALAERIIVAGGGGGVGVHNGGAGGAGGGIVGGDGNPALGAVTNGQGGKGGTATSGGEGGAGAGTGGPGETGSLGVGGRGGSDDVGGGGGGGGGYYGGGGGGAARQGGGGGGGSGFVDSQASDVQFQSGVRGGDGLVTITYTPPDTTPPTLTVTHTADGSNDWNKTSPVTLNISASDSESGLAGAPTCKDGSTDLTLTAGTAGNWTASVSGEGTHTISCSVSDNADHSTSATDTVKIDTKVPSFSSCSVTPSRLKPPNHKLVTATASVQVSDPTGGSGLDGSFTLVSVTSNQADSGLGPGDVPNDIQGWTDTPNDTSGQLRAERYGGARVYTLTYRGTDLAGNTAECKPTVTVPKGG